MITNQKCYDVTLRFFSFLHSDSTTHSGQQAALDSNIGWQKMLRATPHGKSKLADRRKWLHLGVKRNHRYFS